MEQGGRKLTQSVRALVVIAFVFVMIEGLLFYYQPEISEIRLSETAARRAIHVCFHLDAGRLSKEELCHVPVPQIPALYDRYQRLKAQDEAWFQERGWLYYPVVRCVGDDLRIHFMDRRFVCDGPEARLVSAGGYSEASSGLEN